MIFLVLIFAAVVFCFVYFTQKKFNKTIIYDYIPVEKTDLNPDEKELLRLMNQYRNSIGIKPLIPEVLASKICYGQNQIDIENKVKSSHFGWEKRIERCQCDNNDGSEICASYYLSPMGLFQAYLSSPDHKKAIEKKERTHIGISFIQRRNYCLILNHKNN